MLLEARAPVKAMRRIAVSRHYWQMRQLFFQDDMSLVLSYESQQELNAKFIVNISVTVNAVYCHRRRAYREYLLIQQFTNKMATQVYNDNNILMTIVDNDKSDTTHTDMRNMQN